MRFSGLDLEKRSAFSSRIDHHRCDGHHILRSVANVKFVVISDPISVSDVMPKPKLKRGVRLRIVVVTAFGILGATTGLVMPEGPDRLPGASAWGQSRGRLRTGTKPVSNYSKFSHETHTRTLKLECGACHSFPSSNWNRVRTGAEAFPDVTEYPTHTSCLKCHVQQFFKGAQPAICTNCHTNPSPRDGTRHPFPNPREIFDQSPKGRTAVADFAVAFSHDKHIEIVSRDLPGLPRVINAGFARTEGQTSDEQSCSVCHQTMRPQGNDDQEYVTKPPADLGDAFWLKKGTFKSTPLGHTTCFTCHSDDAGIAPAPANCAGCHQLKPAQPLADLDERSVAGQLDPADKVMRDSWRRRDSSGTFRHEWFSHAEAKCATCHQVATMNTADPRTKRVTISACATCHATATSDDGGALNYEIDSRRANPAFRCTKCHVVFGALAIPALHLQALEAAAGK